MTVNYRASENFSSAEAELLAIFEQDRAVLNARADNGDADALALATPHSNQRELSAETRAKLSAAARTTPRRAKQSAETRRRISAAAIKREAIKRTKPAAPPPAKPRRDGHG